MIRSNIFTAEYFLIVAFRGPPDSFISTALKFPERFGRAVRTAATDLALTRLYLDCWICIEQAYEVLESRSRGSPSK